MTTHKNLCQTSVYSTTHTTTNYVTASLLTFLMSPAPRVTLVCMCPATLSALVYVRNYFTYTSFVHTHVWARKISPNRGNHVPVITAAVDGFNQPSVAKTAKPAARRRSCVKSVPKVPATAAAT